MKTIRAWMTLVPLFVAALPAAAYQAWVQPYESGLKAAKSNNWKGAREAFVNAIANRPDDYALPTLLPGPPTEQRRWRNGAPYSPNFLVAYSDYRLALEVRDLNGQLELLKRASNGFEALISKGQVARETAFYLDLIYTKLQNRDARASLATRISKVESVWKVDTEVLAPEELSAIGLPSGTAVKVDPAKVDPTVPVTVNASNAGTAPVAFTGAVPSLANKFALVIGQGTSRNSSLNLVYGANDALLVRDALLDNAGYPAGNIELVTNASAAQIQASIKALTAKLTPDATVFVYFTGAAANIGGRDVLLGVEAESVTDRSAQISKNELFQAFLDKGAKVFSFFQVNRPILDGNYFGSEIAPVGAVSQAQATIPGESVFSLNRNGQNVGLYTNALVSVLGEQRSNQIPVMEFAWQVFYKVRRGNFGSTGGSSRQTPTLPALGNMGFDAKF